MKRILITLLYLAVLLPCFANCNKAIEKALLEYVSDKDARIGIAVIVNGTDTISINGKRDFPMMSVVKFPLALIVAQWIDANGISLNDSIAFSDKDLKENTYSPMLKRYGKKRNTMTVRELLEWSLVESDNNASDILLNHVGGISGATKIMKKIAIPDNIEIGASEDDMHRDPYLSYLNRTTPLAMAQLFDRFDTEMRNTTLSYSEIATMLEQCRTGIDRLVAPLLSSDATIGHKTGTGFPTPDGRISAINDCGYVNLPNGERFSIAVFVADSGYDMAETSAIIAEISRIVWIGLTEQKKD